jgi:hypothetical protein
MTAEDYGLARRMWHQLEPVHALFWYAPEVFAEAAALGYEVTTRWPSYFAWRLAPLGAVGPQLAASACYSFSPHMAGAHVPAAWAVASPPQILAAPHLVLWHAINMLREQRGDGHIAALQSAGLDPCEALVSFAAIGAAPAEVFASRGWSTAEWSAARDRLTGRGWIDAEGNASERGRQGRDEIEWRTDRLADAPWRALGADRAQRLAELTGPLLGTAFESGLLPAQSTLGIATVHAPAPRP